MWTEYVDAYAGKSPEGFRCGLCDWPLVELPSHGGRTLYYHCPRCAWGCESMDESQESSAGEGEPEGCYWTWTFRPDMPGTRPSEPALAVPDLERARRADAHWIYVNRNTPALQWYTAEERETVDKAWQTLSAALAEAHVTGAPCPACLAYEPPPAVSEALPLPSPEDLTAEALREQYYALLEAHEQLRQEYEDLEVAYHATVTNRDHQHA